MPYRAILTTLLTVGLALIAVGLWASAVEPMLATALAATRPAGPGKVEMPSETLSQAAPNGASTIPTADVSLQRLIKGTLLLSFCLICMLLVVGLFASFREWARYSTTNHTLRNGQKTAYVDAWKLAGERMKIKEQEAGESEEGT